MRCLGERMAGAGWTDYRYGSTKKKPTLAKVSLLPDANDYAPLDRKKKKAVVSAVMDLMADWRTSRFEHEGACVAGLRSAFCLRGARWFDADIEASSIVRTALANLGAARPTWEQGQREYCVSRENCSWCGGAVSEELLGGGRRVSFCSTDCARSAMAQRDQEGRRWEGYMCRSAFATIAKLKNAARSCMHCGNLYRSEVKTSRFCSHACAVAKQITIRPRPCKGCGVPFRPRTAAGLYCSKECAGLVKKPVPMCRCANCGIDFQPKRRPNEATPTTCGMKCAAVLRSRSTMYAGTCECCGGAFTSTARNARFCCSECSRLVGRFRTGEFVPKKLTPRVFDYWFTAVAA